MAHYVVEEVIASNGSAAIELARGNRTDLTVDTSRYHCSRLEAAGDHLWRFAVRVYYKVGSSQNSTK